LNHEGHADQSNGCASVRLCFFVSSVNPLTPYPPGLHYASDHCRQLTRRQDLREQLETTEPDVVGEFGSLSEARASDTEADAVVIALPATARDFDDSPVVESLTPREIDVLELVAEGLSNKAVAVRLGISDQTVKFHLTSISGKLGAINRTDAVRRAVQRGLITL
jgi:DNA-binding CsgD family transcriptional regulator